MTANEMATRLEYLVDRTSSSGSPGFEDAELSALLTKAMWQFIKQTISPLTNAKRQGFEESEIRNQGFSNLIKNGTATPSSYTTENLPNGQFVDLPEDFMYTLSESATTNHKCGSNSEFTIADVDVISHNEFSQLRDNPYRKPRVGNSTGRVWRMQIGRTTDGIDVQALDTTAPNRTVKRHELITNGNFTITKYNFRYLKYPNDIVVDFDTPTNQKNCILDDATHEPILEIAASILRTATDRQTVRNIESIENLE
jgi:hypothetical protein